MNESTQPGTGFRAFVLTVLVFCFPALALFIAGCAKPAAENRLRVLCGTSMAKPMQKIAKEFEKANAATVEFDLGGSETLLPRVLASEPGDVYVCHDPFEAKVRAAGKVSSSVVPGWLAPIVVTAVGNPKKIRDWDDLVQPGRRLGIGDPRYSTCGEMFVGEARRRGLEEKLMRNVIVQARSHSELALGVTAGSLDAAAVWNFVAPEYRGKVEPTAIAGDYPEVRVTVIGLAGSTRPALRDRFLEWCRRGESLAAFSEHGYNRSAAAGRTAKPDK
jgi:molybdate transport system substrate-binding protein